MTYNLSRFRLSDYDLTQFPGPVAGDTAPDFELIGEDGETVTLSSFRGRWLVIETASVSCMMYARNVTKMGLLQQKYPDIEWLLVYVREAHPGHRRTAHRSIEQKVSMAKSCRDDYGESRTIAIDDLSGLMHRTYGGLPNMVYVLNPEGKIVYRCDWATVPALERVLSSRPKCDTNEHTMTDDLHYPSVWLTARILWRSGIAAIWDFVREAPRLIPSHRAADKHYLAQLEKDSEN